MRRSFLLPELVGFPLAAFDHAVEVRKLAKHRQHQHDRVLRDRIRIGAAVVRKRYAELAQLVELHAVVAGAQHLDQLHVL